MGISYPTGSQSGPQGPYMVGQITPGGIGKLTKKVSQPQFVAES
jgi:hypothetical protein